MYTAQRNSNGNIIVCKGNVARNSYGGPHCGLGAEPDNRQVPARLFHDFRDVTGDPSVKTDRFTPRPEYEDQGQ